MKYKAIVFDIDGTLTLPMTKDRMNPLPSKKVTTAIKKAAKKVHIALATSRSTKYTQPIFSHLQLQGMSILHGGALISDGLTGKPIWEQNILENDFFTVVNFLNKHHFAFVIDEKQNSGFPYIKGYQPNKVITIFTSELTKEQANFIEKELSHISTITPHWVNSWTPTLWGLNITSSQASKQHALLELAHMLNIDTKEIIGVGDYYNDYPLLMACGLKVAMGNAVPELKEIADYIAPSVQEDGVADVIEKFIL